MLVMTFLEDGTRQGGVDQRGLKGAIALPGLIELLQLLGMEALDTAFEDLGELFCEVSLGKGWSGRF